VFTVSAPSLSRLPDSVNYNTANYNLFGESGYFGVGKVVAELAEWLPFPDLFPGWLQNYFEPTAAGSSSSSSSSSSSNDNEGSTYRLTALHACLFAVISV
jgi:hypothetical protein